MRALSIIIALLLACTVEASSVLNSSGHHFAFGATRDNAFIGLDFGRNPYGRSVSFATSGGRRRLVAALNRAVDAGETRMSFDFGFDFRSVVVLDEDGARLDGEVHQCVETFLVEVETANSLAQRRGSRFEVDVVITDFRLADGISFEGSPPLEIGEHPGLITDDARRESLFTALKPIFRILGRHPLVTLNLMNEPENLSLSFSQVLQRIHEHRWPEVRIVDDDEKGFRKVVAGEAFELNHPDVNEFYSVAYDRVAGEVVLRQALVTQPELDRFLLDMQRAIVDVAPEARVTIGWIDDLSALVRTKELEDQAGGVVTDVISFHVYDVPENPFHPVLTRRENFEALFGRDRVIRITEWGLGNPGDVRSAIQAALQGVQDRGFEGVLFWWDTSHVFDQLAFSQARIEVARGLIDYDGDGSIGFGDFVEFASRYGMPRGDAGFQDRFDLNGNGVIGFGDFVSFVRAYQG
jgi:hypothetical protein